MFLVITESLKKWQLAQAVGFERGSNFHGWAKLTIKLTG